MSIESWENEFYPTPAEDNISSPLQAAKHSLAKWLGTTKENLLKHHVHKHARHNSINCAGIEFVLDVSTCALCLYDEQEFAGSCSGCPLYQNTGISCNDKNSPYVVFVDSDDPTKMIEALDSTVKWLTVKWLTAKELGENNG